MVAKRKREREREGGKREGSRHALPSERRKRDESGEARVALGDATTPPSRSPSLRQIGVARFRVDDSLYIPLLFSMIGPSFLPLMTRGSRARDRGRVRMFRCFPARQGDGVEKVDSTFRYTFPTGGHSSACKTELAEAVVSAPPRGWIAFQEASVSL